MVDELNDSRPREQAVSPDDWRRQGQERYLKGATLIHRHYRSYAKNKKWDHDHCEFCGATFSLSNNPEHLSEGYSTADEYRWICPTCFRDFEEEFGWTSKEHDELIGVKAEGS